MKYLLTDQADKDIDAIWDRIADNNGEKIADRIELKLIEAFDFLAANPLAGHLRNDADNRYRFWSVYSFVIAYQAELKPIVIARVVHGARNFKSLFR